MTTYDIQKLEENIKNSKEFVERGKALDRLFSNRDFKKIVLEGYFKEEAIRLVHLRVDPEMDTPARQESIIKQMDGIGTFNSYLREVERLAIQAEKNIAHDEQTRDELLIEGGEV